jgi:hypothetical protein
MRGNTDTLIECIGQDVTLYKVATTALDTLGDKKTFTYADPIETQCKIHWTPEIRRLKELGLYAEGESLPILCYFKFEDDVHVNDYILLPFEYQTADIITNTFTVADRKLIGQDAEARAVYIIAPRRR